MRQSYPDILALGECKGCDRVPPPVEWYDENGTPRFAPHHPNLCPDIYATEVALLVIACQVCAAEFTVQMSWSMASDIIRRAGQQADGVKVPPAAAFPGLHTQVAEGSIHYGDPPPHKDCASGPTMNCEDLRVVEFWSRNFPDTGSREWARVPALEITLPDGTERP